LMLRADQSISVCRMHRECRFREVSRSADWTGLTIRSGAASAQPWKTAIARSKDY